MRKTIGRIDGRSAALASERGGVDAVGAPYGETASPRENGYVESVNGKLRDELLNGEVCRSGRAEFSIAQVIEFMGAPSATNLAPLPASVQACMIYAAAIHVRSGDRSGAADLSAYLSGQSADTALRAIGMEATR